MNKEDIIVQINKIYQALNAISVQGYGNIKTLGNCLDAMQQLAKDVDSYEKDIQTLIQNKLKEAMQSQTENVIHEQSNSSAEIIPVSPNKPKPQRVKKEVNDIGENRGKTV